MALDQEEVDRQIAHITANLPTLIQLTQVNVTLTSYLIAAGLLSDDDMDELDAVLPSKKKATLFYELIKGKGNFYPCLIEALEAVNQTGVVAILKAIPAI